MAVEGPSGRLAELTVALSLATDLGTGQPMEHGLRTCWLSLRAVRVWQPDGTFVEAAYFTSEVDAREGESSSEFAGPQQEYAELFGEMTFIDLRRLQLS